MMLKREMYLKRIRKFYDSHLIKIIVGIRSCGKSVLISQIIDELKEKGVNDDHIISINFEYIEYQDLLDYRSLYSYVKKRIIDNEIYYLFFDEIQLVDSFEEVVDSLSTSISNSSIFMVGSSSKLLSSELSTVLSGKYVSFNIYPFSFREYIEYTQKEPDTNALNDYMEWGGFPYRLNFNDENNIKDYLYNVYDSIVLRDIVARWGLKDIGLLNTIEQYLVDMMGLECSNARLIARLKSKRHPVSTSTFSSYLDALKKAFLVQKVSRYNVQSKAVLKTNYKYYINDLGIAHIMNNRYVIDEIFPLENVVYNELKTRNYKVCTGKTSEREIDFMASKGHEMICIQVNSFIGSQRTIDKQYEFFKKINIHYPVYVVSLEENSYYSRDNIIYMNIIDFLMSEEF